MTSKTLRRANNLETSIDQLAEIRRKFGPSPVAARRDGDEFPTEKQKREAEKWDASKMEIRAMIDKLSNRLEEELTAL